MSENRIRIELTKEQQNQLKDASGQQVDAVDLSVDELEQRIAPVAFLKFTLTDATITS